jgi:hypothetical protein
MTPNERLKLAYVSFAIRYGGRDTRVAFSKRLGVSVSANNRTGTLNKWLSETDAVDFRVCPEHVARLAVIENLLDQLMPFMERSEVIPDHLFWQVANLYKEDTNG